LRRRALLVWAMCLPAFGTLLPGPSLEKRIEESTGIVVARLTGGSTMAAGDQVSSDFSLRIDRVMKGDVIPGSSVAVHLEGRGLWIHPQAEQVNIPAGQFGIWFLRFDSGRYLAVPYAPGFGEVEMAVVTLPGSAPRGAPGATPAESVANEMVAALRWIAQTKPGQIPSLAQDFRSLGAAATLSVYRELAGDQIPELRVIGISGLISLNDPDGPKRAAAGWKELAASTDVRYLPNDLGSYCNASDREAVRALGSLAHLDPQLEQQASYALRAIHTKDAMPALVSLLDSGNVAVRKNALWGICLFVRNAPAVTRASVPSLAWMTSQQPAPFLDAVTDARCGQGGALAAAGDMDASVSFWKTWWVRRAGEITGN
jgi:hypothetical protein